MRGKENLLKFFVTSLVCILDIAINSLRSLRSRRHNVPAAEPAVSFVAAASELRLVLRKKNI